MAEWQPNRPRPPLPRRLIRRLQRLIPFLTWCGAIAAVVWLGTMLPTTTSFSGIAETRQSSVASPVAGRIAAVLVALHQEAEPDQVLARLDDHDVRLRLTQATYELERMRADLTLEEADRLLAERTAAAEHGLENSVEQRRLVSAVESAQLSALSTRTQLEEARVRVEGSTIEAERLQTLAAQGVVGEPELVRIRTERDALQKRISELQALYDEHRQRVDAATSRLREFTPSGQSQMPIETALAPMRWRLKAQEATLERIVEDSKLLLLRSPIRGRIAHVAVQPGEWVPAGRSLITIVDATPRRILAYVPDAQRPQLDGSPRVRVMRRDASTLGTTVIESVSPSVVRVPERLWLNPRIEEWAFEAAITSTGLERAGEVLLLSLVR